MSELAPEKVFILWKLQAACKINSKTTRFQLEASPHRAERQAKKKIKKSEKRNERKDGRKKLRWKDSREAGQDENNPLNASISPLGSDDSCAALVEEVVGVGAEEEKGERSSRRRTWGSRTRFLQASSILLYWKRQHFFGLFGCLCGFCSPAL